MPLRLRRENWKPLLEKRDDSDCDDESDSCSSSTTSQPIASTTYTASQATPSQSTLTVGLEGAMPPPPPPPTDGPTPPSGAPKPPKPPKQTTTTPIISTTSVTTTASLTTLPTSSKTSTTSSQTSLFANGVGTLPTTLITPPQKQPAPSLTSANSGISSANERSATAIKAASAIIAVEATVIIGALILIFYKLYIRKRRNQTMTGVKRATDHIKQARTPPYNDGNAGARFPSPGPPAAVLRNDGGVWMGPGIVQTSVVSSQYQHQARAPYLQQLGNEQHLGSNPPNFAAASRDVGNPFVAPNEKALPEIQVHEMGEQMHHRVPEIHVQPPNWPTPQEVDRLRMNGMSEKIDGKSLRGEKELLEMERELENLERERERHGG